jgi:predicted outer membrane lipoprotein
MAAAAIGIINALLPMEWVNMKLFKVADAPYDKLTYD